MTANSETPPGLEPVRVDASVTRRHLLKTAATAAPFIATLPSGAALAQASSVQCAAKLQAAPPSDLASDADDQWVRIPADYWDRTNGTTTIPAGLYYRYPVNNPTTTIYSGDGGVTWTSGVTAPTKNNGQGYVGVRYLLVLFQFTDTNKDALEIVGVYPLDGTPSANGDLGMTDSCMASFPNAPVVPTDVSIPPGNSGGLPVSDPQRVVPPNSNGLQ